MGACCSVSWEHQEALAWYAQAGGKTCLSKKQIWTLVASFRAIRETGKRNAYAMKNAKQHYDPRRLTVSTGSAPVVARLLTPQTRPAASGVRHSSHSACQDGSHASLEGLVQGRAPARTIKRPHRATMHRLPRPFPRAPSLCARAQKEHLAEWLPEHSSFKAESLMFRALILAGNPTDGRAHLYPSEFCRMVERVCSVEGPDLARLVFDAIALERIAGRRWISLKRVLKRHDAALRRGTRRGAGVAVGDLALVLEFAEVLKQRSKRGMPVVMTTVEERERAGQAMTLKEFLSACRRTPQILWPAQWIQRHFRQQFFGERWWNGLVRRSARLGLPPDDDALESAAGQADVGDSAHSSAAVDPDATAAKGSAQDPTTAARRALSGMSDDVAASVRGPLHPAGSSARLTAANKAWAETGAAGAGGSDGGAGGSLSRGRSVQFAEGTKAGAEPGEGAAMASPREDAAGDVSDALDLSSDGVSALTALVLAAERKRSGGELAAARAEAARRRGEVASSAGEGTPADSKQAAMAGASLAVASATVDFAARLKRRAMVRRAKGFAAPARDVYSEVAAPGGAGIDAALGFSGSGSGPGGRFGGSGSRAGGRAGRASDGGDSDEEDERVELVGDDLSGLEGGGADAGKAGRAGRSQKRMQARARRQRARVAAEAGAIAAAGEVRPPGARRGRQSPVRVRAVSGHGDFGGGADRGPDGSEADRRARARAAIAARASGASPDQRRLPKTLSHSAAMARAARSAFPGLTRPPSSRDLPRVQSSIDAVSPSSSALATRPAFPSPDGPAASASPQVEAEPPAMALSRAARRQGAAGASSSSRRRLDVSGSSGVSLVSMSRGSGDASLSSAAGSSVAVRVLQRPAGRSGGRRPR